MGQRYTKHVKDVHLQISDGKEMITVTFDNEIDTFSLWELQRIERKLNWKWNMFSVYHSSTKKTYSTITLFFHPQITEST